MNYLLDTCTFLWLALSPGKLSAAAVSVLNNPASRLHISDVSLWEITLKHSAGKLSLPDVPRIWIPLQLQFSQVQTVSLKTETIFRSGELPGVHSDPFDRLIAAQALDASMTILSPDVPLSLLGAARVW